MESFCLKKDLNVMERLFSLALCYLGSSFGATRGTRVYCSLRKVSLQDVASYALLVALASERGFTHVTGQDPYPSWG